MKDRGNAFKGLPKLIQVSMIHSGALPDSDEAVKSLAAKMEGK